MNGLNIKDNHIWVQYKKFKKYKLVGLLFIIIDEIVVKCNLINEKWLTPKFTLEKHWKCRKIKIIEDNGIKKETYKGISQ